MKLDTLPEVELLMGNCILAAAVTVYCGPLTTHARHSFFESLRRICRLQGFPAAHQELDHVLKLEHFPQFMLGEVIRSL